MTLLEVLQAAAGHLSKKGIENPRLNAEHLLAHALGKAKRLDLYLDFDRPMGENAKAPFRELIRRRSEGVPLQHLLGTVEFFGRTFACDARALIPRPETEQLVEFILRLAPEARSFMDVGTGSGILAITFALEKTAARVEACDISPEALALACENIRRHSLDGRLQPRLTSLLTGIPGRFNVIAANLPYIPTGEIPGLSREVGHDPKTALDGGPDGLDLIRELAVQAVHALEPGGLLALETGIDQATATTAWLATQNYRDITIERDYQGVQRFVFARHG